MKAGHWVLIIFLVVALLFAVYYKDKILPKNIAKKIPSIKPKPRPNAGQPKPSIDTDEIADAVQQLVDDSMTEEDPGSEPPPEGRAYSVKAALTEMMSKIIAYKPVDFFSLLNSFGLRKDKDLLDYYSESPYARQDVYEVLNQKAKQGKDITGKRCAGGTWQYIKGEGWVCVFDKS